MEKLTKPQNLYIRRNRALTAAAAFAFLAFAVALAALLPLGLIKYPPEKDILIPLIIGNSFIIFISFCLGALNFRNLFFPFLLTADEKGVYNYSGYFHFGFIDWEDILSFTKDATWLDLLDDDMPSLKIYLKNFKAYRSTLSFYKKWQLFWSFGDIKIYTLCSQIKRKQLYVLLDEMLKYYGSSAEQVD